MSSSCAEWGTPGRSVIARTEIPRLRTEICCRSNASTSSTNDASGPERFLSGAQAAPPFSSRRPLVRHIHLQYSRASVTRRGLSRRQEFSIRGSARYGTQDSGHEGFRPEGRSTQVSDRGGRGRCGRHAADATVAAAAPARLPSVLPPTTQTIAAETNVPQAELNRIGGVAGSDFMVNVIKTLDIKYLPANCASSFRGIHESLINYGNNKMPEFLTCTHEESAVAMAHGYFKIAGKPLMTLCHGTVGLQHATMAIYNAWCDRVPVIVVGG